MQISIPDEIKIFFFDMDHTLINNDCDVSWKAYLRKKKMSSFFEYLESKWHYAMYRLGRLNEDRFIRFQLRQFRGKTKQQMEPLLKEHFIQYVKPAIYPAAFPLLARLREKKIKLILLTATNTEIAAPLADFLQMDGLLATKLCVIDHCYTGAVAEEVCLGTNKLKCMETYLRNEELSLAEVSYWGDSTSDIPVLKQVGFPVAANPVPGLRDIAKKNRWTTIDFAHISTEYTFDNKLYTNKHRI